MTHDDRIATKVKTVPVFVNRSKLELPPGPMSAATLLSDAGFEGTTWDILQLQGEGDPSGGTLLAADITIDIKAGLHFRVLPGNRTFGAGHAWPCQEPPDGNGARA